jgi:oligopeptide transport system substrate-binding protein
MRSKQKFRVITLASVLCLFAVFFAACGGGNSSNTPSSDQAASADKQVVTIPNEGGDFDTLDPALTNGAGDPLNLIFTGLVNSNPDGTVINQMAANVAISTDGLTYTFTLKDGLKFSDGSELTADDIAYSLNRVVLPATKSGVSSYLGLLKDYDKASTGAIPTLIGDSIIVKDKKTISLVLSKKAAYFLQALTYPTSYVVNKKIVDKYGEKWTDHLADAGASSGPFKVQSYGHTTSLVLVPNENYYGDKPKLTKIEYVMAGDRDSNYKAFQAGQYTYAPVPPSQDEKAATLEGYQHPSALASRFISMNYLAKPFDNIKIRQAFALALKRDLIINNIIGKYVTPSNHIVPNGIPGYNEKLTGPAGVSSTNGDQTKAKQLLADGLKEAGYASVAALPPITLTYNTDYKAGADTMTAAISQWKEVLGVTIKPNGVPANDLLDKQTKTVGNNSLQMWYGNWGADYPDPQDWLSVFFGKGSDHNAVNYGQNTSPNASAQQAIQAKLEQADGETDNTKRMALYQEAEQSIVNEAGWITTYQSSYVYSVNPKLKNWKLTPLGLVTTAEWLKVYVAQ